MGLIWPKKPEETKKTSSLMISSLCLLLKFPSLTVDLEPVPPISKMMDLSTDLTETIPKTELMPKLLILMKLWKPPTPPLLLHISEKYDLNLIRLYIRIYSLIWIMHIEFLL